MTKLMKVDNIWKIILAIAIVLAIALWLLAGLATDWLAGASNKVLLVLQGSEALALAVGTFCVYQLLSKRKNRVLLTTAFGIGFALPGVAMRLFVTHQHVLRMAVLDFGGVAVGVCAAVVLPGFQIFLKKHLYDGLNQNPDKRKKLESVLDALSLAAAFAYVGYTFLWSTTFPLIYTNMLRYFVVALVLCGGLRFAYFFLRELWPLEDQTARLKFVGKTLLAFCIAIPFVLSGVMSERDQLIVLPLLMLCFWRMQPERVLRSYVLVVGVLLAATVLCCLAGCIQNISTLEGKSSYGIINTTDFAAYFIFLLLCVWCSQRIRTWYTTLFVAALSIATAAATYYLAGSRTTVICCALVVVACLWEWLASNLVEKSKLVRGCAKAVDALCVGAFPLTAVALTYITHAYSKGAPWALQLDELLSHRIKPLWEVFNKQGIHLLGKVFKMHGQGSSVLGPGATYDFLDSSYSYLLIRNGVLIFAVVACLWVWMSFRAARGGRRRFVLALAIVAFYGFSECQMINVNYCIFLAMLFCAFAEPPESVEASPTVAKRWFASFAVGALLAIAVYLFAPKILSWLRTAFYLLGWTNSYRTGWALLLAVAGLACLLLIWKTAPLAVQRGANVPKVAFAASLIALAAGVLWTNSVIQQGLESRGAELDAEQEAIRLIQSTATQPVFAAEKSELYQRKFGGISDFTMDADDLTRARRGTILVDKAHDSIWLPVTGASYVPFSETSGLYTYDPAVVEAFKKLGKKITRFNSSEHTGDLDDLARLNGLRQDEHCGLELIGSNHSLSESRAMDQLAGSYEVRLDLHADSDTLKKLGKGHVCVFRAMINKDEIPICERPIAASEFNKEGSLVVTIPYAYKKSHMPRLQYTITAAEGATVCVDNISWKRVG